MLPVALCPQCAMFRCRCDNCHSHVACCLNNMKYGGSTDWNMVKLAAWMFFAGKFVNVGRTIATFLPFALIVAVIVLLRVFV